MDDGVVELDFRQVDEHSSDLGSSLLANQLLDVLVDGVADDLLLLLPVGSFLVLSTGEHVSDFEEVLVSVALVNQLGSSRGRGIVGAGGIDADSSRDVWCHSLAHHLLLHHQLLSLHLLGSDHALTTDHHLRSRHAWSHRRMSHLHGSLSSLGPSHVALSVLVPILHLVAAHLRLLVLASIVVLRSIGNRVETVRSPLVVVLTQLEGRLEQQGQQVDEVLRTIQACDLSLVLLIPLSILSPLVVNLLVSDGSHLPRVAVLHVKGVLTLEEHISSKLFCKFALILLLKVDESLLSALDDVDSADFSLAAALEVNLELLFSRANREVLYEQAEEHNRLLVSEVLHLDLIDALRLLLSLSDIQV